MATSQYIDARGLAERLCTSRRNIHYRLASGYLPAPIFKSRAVTLWDVRDIDRWQAAGFPWADPERARKVAAAVGTETLNRMVAPDADPDRDITFSEQLAIRAVDKEFAAED